MYSLARDELGFSSSPRSFKDGIGFEIQALREAEIIP